MSGGRRRTAGFTLIELMVVISMIALIGAIAYPSISDTLRTLRARDAAKSLVNAILVARAEAMIRNQAHQVVLTPSTTVGSRNRTTGGGSVLVQRAEGSSCATGNFTLVTTYGFADLGDVNLCVIRTDTSLVDASTTCQTAAVTLCVTPDGTVTNLGATTAQNTLAYVRENAIQSGAVVGVGVVRQVIIPRRKAPKVSPIQVNNDACL